VRAPTSSRWRVTSVLGFAAVVCIAAANVSHVRTDSDSGYTTTVDSRYKSPINLKLSSDGRFAYVVCEKSGELICVDLRTRRPVASAHVGGHPFDLAVSRDGTLIFVTCRETDSVVVIDSGSFRERDRFAAGFNPHGLAIDTTGHRLFVANMAADNLSIVDSRAGTLLSTIGTGRQPFDVAISPDNRLAAVTNQLSDRIPFRATPFSEITIVDVASGRVTARMETPGCVIHQGVTWTPDGKWILAVTEIPRNLVPETQMYQGWMVTYALMVVEPRRGGRVGRLLLDDANLYYADPFDVVCSPDGETIYISSSGADVVNVLSWSAVTRTLRIREDRITVNDDSLALYARHLGLSGEYVVARVPCGTNPKGMALNHTGDTLYVANRLSDAVGIIDTRLMKCVGEIALGGPTEITELREGERLFNYASISFQKQVSCATCHPENNVDGLLYDIAADGGFGRNIVDNRTMRGIAGTAPFKWSGKNPTIERQEGPRAAQLFFRSHGFDQRGVRAISHFIESLPLTRNRYLSPDSVLTPAQMRGKALFYRTCTNTGAYIPIGNRCITCHEPPLYTSRRMHNVGTQADHDLERHFDTPQLNRVYETPPFLHDGRCWSLEEIWTLHNPDDLHGQTNDMMKEQLNDLIEYMKTF